MGSDGLYFEGMAALFSGGQLAATVLLFWRVFRLERKFENGVNKKIDDVKDKLNLMEIECIRKHPDPKK